MGPVFRSVSWSLRICRLLESDSAAQAASTLKLHHLSGPIQVDYSGGSSDDFLWFRAFHRPSHCSLYASLNVRIHWLRVGTLLLAVPSMSVVSFSLAAESG